MTTIEIDGVSADGAAFAEATSPYGHFTAMQVRGGRTRGLELHLRRLASANREAFDADLDGERVRALIRHALGDTRDASVRVYIHERSPEPAIAVTVEPPAEMATPQRLRSVRYQRPDAHRKHVHTEQGGYRELAHRDGFDDALLTGPDGLVCETSMANIGFLDPSGVVWPDAPMLHGITMQLLEEALPTRRTPVHLPDIASFDGAFLSNARGIGVVSCVDDDRLPIPAARMRELIDAYASVPWETI
ncbi:MAG TPA: aminotransferase class IV [Actinomycetota bacterium]|nr:aminotransferase class IV [Actinomycetota bacterium]